MLPPGPDVRPEAVKALTFIKVKAAGAVCEKTELADMVGEHICVEPVQQCLADPLMTQLRRYGNKQ